MILPVFNRCFFEALHSPLSPVAEPWRGAVSIQQALDSRIPGEWFCVNVCDASHYQINTLFALILKDNCYFACPGSLLAQEYVQGSPTCTFYIVSFLIFILNTVGEHLASWVNSSLPKILQKTDQDPLSLSLAYVMGGRLLSEYIPKVFQIPSRLMLDSQPCLAFLTAYAAINI